jgi:fatty acid desaturase
VTHRMQLAGEKGPMPPAWAQGKLPEAPMNVAYNFFSSMWRAKQPYRNMMVYSLSMFLERLVLIISDKVVALTGFNAFFPNKPAAFHQAAANHARLALLFQAAVLAVWGWKALVLLFISETAWSLPLHPGCAMFITNHGSSIQPVGDGRNPAGLGEAADGGSGCQPTRSTYAGLWYDAVCCNTNYHLEHHDFPNIPILDVPKLRRIAPEFYDSSAVTSGSDLWQTVKEAFAEPDFYACMGASPDGLRLLSSERGVSSGEGGAGVSQ